MSDPSIVVVGGCVVDLISYADRFPKPGETLVGQNFVKGYGGKAANQCVMAKKLGGLTAMISKLGDDNFGKEYLENLKKLEINSDFVTFSKSAQTSTASITVSKEGQNTLIYTLGAMMELKPSDFKDAEKLISRTKVLMCTHECPLDSLVTACELARKHKVKTVLNAAPTIDSSYEKLYSFVDIICLNEVEAQDATGMELKDISDCGEMFNVLQKKGCSTVILTLGSKGAVYKSKNQKDFGQVTAKTVKAVDPTGAGDAFMGSLVYFLSEYPDMDLETIISKACEIATMSVLKEGAQSSFPKREDLPEDFFNQK